MSADNRDVKNTHSCNEKYLVAVSDSPGSGHVLQEAIAMAGKDGADLVVLHVRKPEKMLQKVSDRLARYYDTAVRHGAETIIVVDDKISRGILRTAEEKKVSHIIMGNSCRGAIASLTGNQPVHDLLRENRGCRITVISAPVSSGNKSRHLFPIISYRIPLSDYGLVLIGVVIITLLNLLIVRFVGYWSIALLYLFFISFIALFLRVRPVLLAALLSSLLWNFLFIPPKYTLTIARFEDVLMLAIFFVNAVIIGTLTAQLRLKEQILEKSEKKISALYNISRELGNAGNMEEITALAEKNLKEYAKADSVSFFTVQDFSAEKTGDLPKHASDYNGYGAADTAEAIFRMLTNNRYSGLNADFFPGIHCYLAPLSAGGSVIGAFSIKPPRGVSYDPEEKNFLDNIMYLVSAAAERDSSLRLRQEALLHAESERLYKVLFNLVSHELKTPLTTIKGASTSLADTAVDAIPETRQGLYQEIRKAGDRIDRLFENLLSMSRIESGHLLLEKKPHDLHDLISISLKSIEQESAGHSVVTDIPPGLPDIWFDFYLMEQVVANLVHNCCIYTQPGSVIIVSASVSGDKILLTVKDNGPGFQEEDIPLLFGKFRRQAKKNTGGIGLGLSICRGIVEAHGGYITGGNNPSGGAEFRIVLPVNHDA